jgi:hypothetical protein
MIRRSCLLAPLPQLPGCPRPTRCLQIFPSVLWLQRWAAYGTAGADRVVAGNSDTALLNPVLRQSVSINSSNRGTSQEIEHSPLEVDSRL